MTLPVTPAAIHTAYDRIRPHVRRTPLMRADRIAGADVTFKLELTQHAGS